MLEDEPSALVLFDGMIEGWFTGVGLPQYFDADTDDPYNARRTVNGTDKADLIAGYHREFLAALT
jgi:putative chitinase